MFNLDQSATFWWPVKFSTPKECGAQHETSVFDAEFKRLPVEEIDAMLDRANRERISDSKLVPEVLVGWKGVVDRTGAPVPFSVESMQRATALPGFGAAVMKAFLASLVEAPAKN